MDIQITFRDGPIEAEVSAAEGEAYTDVLDALAEFVEEYEPAHTTPTQQTPVEANGGPSQATEEASSGTPEREDGTTDSVFPGVDAAEGELQRVLKMGSVEDGDVNEFPQIIADPSILAESNEEQILHAAAVVLAILDEFHGVSKVKTSDLKDAVGESGIDIDNWSNIYRNDKTDLYLNRRGSGPSATAKLRQPGKEDAADYIQTLVDSLRGEGGSDE